jgi:hypothetical protein
MKGSGSVCIRAVACGAVVVLGTWGCALATSDTVCGAAPDCDVARPCFNAAAPTPGCVTQETERPALSEAPLGLCGDGQLDRGEQCDNGSACDDGRDCTRDRHRCQIVSGGECRAQRGDGCDDTCKVEAGYRCADGIDCRALPSDLETTPAPPLNGAPSDADAGSLDATSGACELGRFEEPEPLGGLAASVALWAPALSADGRTLYFASRAGGSVERLFAATRVAEDSAAFASATPLSSLDSGQGEGTPLLSFDAQTLYFYSQRAGLERDLWFATWQAASSAFGVPTPLDNLNSASIEHLPWLSLDELTLLFVSTRSGGLGQSDVWSATRADKAADFAELEPLASINSSRDEGRAVLSSDGLTVFFASAREGSLGSHDLWTATRTAPGEPFPEPTNLAELNSPNLDTDVFLAHGERELFFASDRRGQTELWRSVRGCAD